MSASAASPGSSDAPVSIFEDDETDAAREGWQLGVDVPRDAFGIVETGARHFIACLLGEATPVLTAEHARHVLDVDPEGLRVDR